MALSSVPALGTRSGVFAHAKISRSLRGTCREGTSPTGPVDKRAAADRSSSSPPTADSVSSALAKAFAGTCENNLRVGLPARRTELEQQHPSKAASERERGNAPHPGGCVTQKIKAEGNIKS